MLRAQISIKTRRFYILLSFVYGADCTLSAKNFAFDLGVREFLYKFYDFLKFIAIRTCTFLLLRRPVGIKKKRYKEKFIDLNRCLSSIASFISSTY